MNRPGGFGGPPASFGRARAEQQDVPDKEQPGQPTVVAGGLKVVDGRLVLEVEARLLLPDEVLQGLYDQVREVVALATADGLATATGQPLPGAEEPQAEELGS